MENAAKNDNEQLIPKEQQIRFAGAILLDKMLREDWQIPLVLDRDHGPLEPVLEWLLGREYIVIVRNRAYATTDRGRAARARFAERYENFLKTMDVYAAVDLDEGDFAFERVFDFEDDADWDAYLDDERWEDLRLAVAEYKGMDRFEVLVMSFLAEERFDTEEVGWQFDLVLGTVWDELRAVLQSHLRVADLAYDDVSGEEVIRDVIRQGAELNVQLKRQEAELTDERGRPDEDDEEESVEVYETYYDPLYVPPVWMGVWWI